MIRYCPIETHTHTIHSDGDFTVEELLQAAAADGYAGLILSDHNTDSGWQDVTPELMRKYVPAARAVEWTTFYGHVLVVGAGNLVDWRDVTPDTFDEALDRIARAGGIAGIAHPFSMGGVLYTGGFFSFHVHDWDKVSFAEVWSKAANGSMKSNARALAWWMSLLNRGYHLAVTSGRDWHRPDHPERPFAVTYVGLRDGVFSTETVCEALRAGRTSVTYGAVPYVEAAAGGRTYGIGETVPSDRCMVTVRLEFGDREECWRRWNYSWNRICLIADGRTAAEQAYDGNPAVFRVQGCRWFIAAVYGRRGNGDEEMLAMTSPVWLEGAKSASSCEKNMKKLSKGA